MSNLMCHKVKVGFCMLLIARKMKVSNCSFVKRRLPKTQYALLKMKLMESGRRTANLLSTRLGIKDQKQSKFLTNSLESQYSII
jgi:hypothetical protein